MAGLMPLCASIVLASTGLAAADPIAAPGTSAALSCHQAAMAAEHDFALPPGLLDAIGRVESGRYDRATSQLWAWPWAVNAAGEGRSFENFADAAAFVRERQGAGVQSIDVGCFQINLMHHPNAFASLEEAFDPAANAGFAARFLLDLRQRTGGWATATAFYHSATPGLGEPYRDMVLARWPGHAPEMAALNAMPWEMPRDLAGRRDVVRPIEQGLIDHVMISLANLPSGGIRVWTPTTMMPRGTATMTPTMTPAMMPSITPTLASAIMPVAAPGLRGAARGARRSALAGDPEQISFRGAVPMRLPRVITLTR